MILYCLAEQFYDDCLIYVGHVCDNFNFYLSYLDVSIIFYDVLGMLMMNYFITRIIFCRTIQLEEDL